MATNKFNDFSNPVPIANGGTNAVTVEDALSNLGITIGNKTIVGTTDQIIVTNGDGSMGNPTLSLANNTVIAGSGAMRLPSGNTSQRPVSPTLGMIRANSQTNQVEIYSDGAWSSVALYALGSPIMSIDVEITYSDLSSGGQITLISAFDIGASYKISNILINGIGGTNFLTGDRDISVTDGSNVYTVVPSSSLLALTNDEWGSTAVPFPASVGMNQPTIAGADLLVQYSGGTLDYTQGNVVLTIEYSRVS